MASPTQTRSTIVIQKRDLLILHEIAESPACLRRHIALAFFEGRYEAAKKRLQLLAKAGLIENADESRTGRSIVCLTEKGRTTLIEEGFSLDGLDSPALPERFRLHEMMLADCRAALLSLRTKSACASVEFSHGPDAAFSLDCSEHGNIETVRPDGFVQIAWGKDMATESFFIEIDRGTETLGHLIHLMQQYDAFRRSGDFRLKSRSRGAGDFRVLLIVESQKRLRNIAEELFKRTQIRTLVWSTTFEAFTKSPAGSIWYRPVDRGLVPCPLF